MAPTSPADGLNAALAATLRAERAATSMTVDRLAAKSGIPKRTLLRLLNAERHINTDHLYALATAFELEPADLIVMAQRRLGRVQRWEADQAAGQGWLAPGLDARPSVDDDAPMAEEDELAQKRARRQVPSDLPDIVTDEDLIGQPSVATPEPRNDVEGTEDPEDT